VKVSVGGRVVMVEVKFRGVGRSEASVRVFR
jgi:hypothetical protein